MSKSRCIPPIHRLDSSSWSSLVSFIGSRDILNLCNASRRISSTLKPVVRRLNVSWQVLRHIDMEQVLSFIASFSHVQHASFHQERSVILCKPLSAWPNLPATLTSLSMSYRRAVYHLFGSDPPGLATMLPNLLHIEAEDHYRPAWPHYTRLHWMRYPSITFQDLPSRLETLCIRSKEGLNHQCHGVHFPETLKDLELSFSLGVLGRVSGWTDLLHELPKLPSTLKRFKLVDTESRHWRMSFLDLPSSLETLHLEIQEPVLHFRLKTHRSSRLDLTHASTHLRDLRHFCVPGLKMTATQALELLPESVEEIDAWITAEDDESDFALERIVPCLKTLHQPSGRLVKTINSDLVDIRFPSLKTLLWGYTPKKWLAPSSVTHLETPYWLKHTIQALPQGVRIWKTVFCPSLNSAAAPHLEKLILSQFGDNSLRSVEELPRTLQEIECHMEGIELLFPVLSRLPHLHTIKNLCWQSFECLRYIPPRLRTLEVKIDPDMVHLTTELLLCLSDSNLRELRIEVGKDKDHELINELPWSGLIRADEPLGTNGGGEQINDEHLRQQKATAEVVALLNFLPSSLKSFTLVARALPSLEWKVKLPNGLEKLKFWQKSRRLPIQAKKESNEILLQDCHFELPASLTYLSIDPTLRFPKQNLPPNLSHYNPPEVVFTWDPTSGDWASE